MHKAFKKQYVTLLFSLNALKATPIVEDAAYLEQVNELNRLHIDAFRLIELRGGEVDGFQIGERYLSATRETPLFELCQNNFIAEEKTELLLWQLDLYSTQRIQPKQLTRVRDLMLECYVKAGATKGFPDLKATFVQAKVSNYFEIVEEAIIDLV